MSTPQEVSFSAGERELRAAGARIHAIYAYTDLIDVLLFIYSSVGKTTAESKLKARFRKWQAEGMPTGQRPRRGQRTGYTFMQLCQIVFCCELAEVGLDPSQIAAFAHRGGIKIGSQGQTLAFATKDSFLDFAGLCIESNFISQTYEDKYIILVPSLMSKAWNDENEGFGFHYGPSETLAEVASQVSRFIVVNTETVSRRLSEALDAGGLPAGDDPQA